MVQLFCAQPLSAQFQTVLTLYPQLTASADSNGRHSFFGKILRLRPSWFVNHVAVKEKEQRSDIFVGHEPHIGVKCPVGDTFYGMYDHTPERVYRQLDTCQIKTFIHVRPPRVKCPNHGVKQIDSEFGENSSEMTFAIESLVIRVARECCIEAAGRLCGLSWERSFSVLSLAVERCLKRKVHRVPQRIGMNEKSIACRY